MIEIFINHWEAMRKLITGERMDKREANMVFWFHLFACATLNLISVTSLYYFRPLFYALPDLEKSFQENVSIFLSIISAMSAVTGLFYFIKFAFLLGTDKYPNFKQAFFK